MYKALPFTGIFFFTIFNELIILIAYLNMESMNLQILEENLLTCLFNDYSSFPEPLTPAKNPHHLIL